MRHVIAIDQGTTGTTVLVLDEELRLRGRGYREFQQHYPEPGWVEHDPEQIWGSVTDALAQALAQAKAALEGGRTDYPAIEAEARDFLDSHGFRVDYLAARKCSDLLPPSGAREGLVVLGAAWLGTTRLIDNMEACVAD